MKTANTILFFFLLLPFSEAQTSDSLRIKQEVDSLLKTANNLSEKREYKQALQINEAAEKLVLTTWDKHSIPYADLCANKGRILSASGKHADAEPWLLEAAALRGQLLGREHEDYAFSLNALGGLYRSLGQYAKAEPYYLEALPIREKVFGKNHSNYAGILFNLGLLYRDMGRFDAAETHFVECREIRLKTSGKDNSSYTNCIHNLALLYIDMGKFEASEALFKEVLDLKAKGPVDSYGESLSAMATLYLTTGEFDLAEPLLLEALEIREKTRGKTHVSYAVSLESLANLYFVMGNYAKAEPLVLESRAIREKNLGKDHPLYARTLALLSGIYFYTEKLEESESLLLEVKALQEKSLGTEHPSYARTLNNLLFFYGKRREYERADQVLAEVLQIREKLTGKNHHEYAEALNHRGQLLYERRRYAEAEGVYQEALPILAATLGEKHESYLNCLENQAMLYLATGRWEEARQNYTTAFSLRQHLFRNAAFHLSEVEMEKYINKFESDNAFIYTLARKNDDAELAFNNVLYLKGFLLGNTLEIRQKARQDPELLEDYQQLQSMYYRLAAELSKPTAERQNVVDLENKANLLEKELVRAIGNADEMNRVPDWKTLQNELEPDEAAIEFIHFPYCYPQPTDSVVYAALLLKAGMEKPAYIPLFDEKQLQIILRGSSGQGAAGHNELYAGNTGKALQNLLWSPLLPHLSGIKKVWYAPSGLLHRINLSALPISDKQSLEDIYQLILLSSTRYLPENKKRLRQEGHETALVYGAIQFEMDSIAYPARPLSSALEYNGRRGIPSEVGDSTQRNENADRWQYLKWSEREADNVAGLLTRAGFSTTTQKGWQATEENFKLTGKETHSPYILHISTHGFFFPDPIKSGRSILANSSFRANERPMLRAGLILAGANYAWLHGHPLGNREDGILTAYEISQMDLSHTNLVVLSACETGLGKIDNVEGVYGLQRAFKAAGARQIIMSLWQVPDYQTQELMTSFYRHLLEKKMTARMALKAARDEMKIKRYEPYFWAGFVLIE
ncbi:MAG: tetratricopeptide repeat protein [Saprospiraceae bacterium]|nr:tetratricopeptide repeat protein [Saprospiraceae bacterium]